MKRETEKEMQARKRAKGLWLGCLYCGTIFHPKNYKIEEFFCRDECEELWYNAQNDEREYIPEKYLCKECNHRYGYEHTGLCQVCYQEILEGMYRGRTAEQLWEPDDE